MTYDPQSTTFTDAFELSRCCFVRTLVTYNGGSVEDGGTVVRPDLATALPTVSPDGLTWTFHLRSGVHYAPPFEDTEIVAGDFIRSFERALSPASAGRSLGRREVRSAATGRTRTSSTSSRALRRS